MPSPALLTVVLEDAAAAPAWMVESAFWLAVLAAFVALGGVVMLGFALRELRGLAILARRVDVLEELRDLLGRLVNSREDLDLRRIEHVLVDLKESQSAVGDAVMRAVERAPSTQPGADPAPALAGVGLGLGERVVNRLLAMGYERVQFVTSLDDLEPLSETDGEVLVEARRQGALYKGRVLVRGGRITDVELQPNYSAFP
jgi:hypothetical protein